MKHAVVIIALCCCTLYCPALCTGPFPRLLPPAEKFRFTLREDPHSTLPLAPSCTGEAGVTLTCRAFLLTLENVGEHTVHINGFSCGEPDITIVAKQSNSSMNWWPASRPTQLTCPSLPWTNLRLKPGERMQYATRLISARRSAQSFDAGEYTLQATWILFGCTDAPGQSDCLSPLQVIHKPSSVAPVALQEPVILRSNEVIADSPPLPDLGELKFAFDVTVHNGPPDEALASSWAAARCPAQGSTNIDCTVFDYVIRNLGSRAVRNATFSCSDSDIRAEYAVSDGAWKPVPVKLWACWNNYLVETKILPGGEIKGEFMLTTLAPPYSTAALRAAGQYQLRFIFEPRACIASPDASFCLVWPKKQPPVTSQQITLRTGGGG